MLRDDKGRPFYKECISCMKEKTLSTNPYCSLCRRRKYKAAPIKKITCSMCGCIKENISIGYCKKCRSIAWKKYYFNNKNILFKKANMNNLKNKRFFKYKYGSEFVDIARLVNLIEKFNRRNKK